MALYGLMVVGAAALIGMMLDGLRNASPRRAFVSSVAVLGCWFALCLAVCA
jgi:hypothetical protein